MHGERKVHIYIFHFYDGFSSCDLKFSFSINQINFFSMYSLNDSYEIIKIDNNQDLPLKYDTSLVYNVRSFGISKR